MILTAYKIKSSAQFLLSREGSDWLSGMLSDISSLFGITNSMCTKSRSLCEEV